MGKAEDLSAPLRMPIIGGYEVLTAITMKSTIFWGVSHRRFGGTYYQ
jgi:hypothetical protein